MASINQARRAAMAGTSSFFGVIGAALRSLGSQRAGVSGFEQAPTRARTATSELFARAQEENSNSAMDWLYYAAQLRDEERHACLVRASQLAYGDRVIIAEIRRLST